MLPKDYCVSYKLNIAFYECLGAKGWEILEDFKVYSKDIFTIYLMLKEVILATHQKNVCKRFQKHGFDSVTGYLSRKISVSPLLESMITNG